MRFWTKVCIGVLLGIILLTPNFYNLSYATNHVTFSQPLVNDHSFRIIVTGMPPLPQEFVELELRDGTIVKDRLNVPIHQNPSNHNEWWSDQFEINSTGIPDDSDHLITTTDSTSPTLFVIYPSGVDAHSDIVRPIGTAVLLPLAMWNSYTTSLCPGGLNNKTDVDGDAICDAWENSGDIIIPPDVVSPPMSDGYFYDCNPACGIDKQDILVEVDWMVGHKMEDEAKARVIEAFQKKDIRLHVQVNSQSAIDHKDVLFWPGFNDPNNSEYLGFQQVKAREFGTPEEQMDPTWHNQERWLKHQIFHYALFVHDRQWEYGSGVAEKGGNDMMISLGGFSGNVGSIDQQAGTFMHELGHNLRLDHGGEFGDTTNCKPNYFSVMSYSRQFAEPDSNRLLDYSEQILDDVDTNPGLNENSLIGDPIGLEEYVGHLDEKIIYSYPSGATAPLIYTTGGQVDWDGDGLSESVENSGILNINNLWMCHIFPGMISPPGEVLIGHNDWSNVHYNFTESGDFANGVSIIPSGPDELPSYTNMTSSLVEALDQEGTSLHAKSSPDFLRNVDIDENSSEMGLVSLTKLRIGSLAGLYHHIMLIPSNEFKYDLESDPQTVITDSNIMQTSKFLEYNKDNVSSLAKVVILFAIKETVKEINHHDLEDAKRNLQIVDATLSANLEKYHSIKPITENIIKSYSIALDFNPTLDYHDDSIHRSLSTNIIPQEEIDNFWTNVVDYAISVGGDEGCIPGATLSQDHQCISLLQPQPPVPWWIWIILFGIFLAIAIVIWLRNHM